MTHESLTPTNHNFCQKGHQQNQNSKFEDTDDQKDIITDLRPADNLRQKITIPSTLDFQSESELKKFIKHLLKKLPQDDPVGRDYVGQYLIHLYRKNLRPNTVRNYYTAILLFSSYLKRSGKNHIEKITRNDLSGFVEHEQDRGMKPASVRSRLKSLSAFLGFLIEKEVVDPDLLKKRMTIKVPDTLPKAIDPDDIKKALSVIDNTRNRAMIVTLLRTGMRIGELLETKVIDLNMKEKRIEIFEAQKNRVGRIVYLSADAITALQAWLKIRDQGKLTWSLFCSANLPVRTIPSIWWSIGYFISVFI